MKNENESGFSYVEVMIAMVILLVGVLALLSASAAAALLSSGQNQQLNAVRLASSTMESLMSTKETDPNRLGWSSIGNIGTNLDGSGVPRGIFVNGRVDVRQDPGPDQIIGTADDTGPTIPGLQRQISITDVCDPDRPSANCATPGSFPVRFRTVQVSVFYWVGGVKREERITTLLTDYSLAE